MRILIALLLVLFTIPAYAGEKLSRITGTTVATGDDIIYIVDNPSGTPASKYISKSEFLDTITATDVSSNKVVSGYIYSDNTVGGGEITGIVVTGDTVRADGALTVQGTDWNSGANLNADVIADGSTNAAVTLTQETNWDTHLSSDGSDHTFIDQDVTTSSAPTFTADNLSDGGTNAIVTTTQESNWDTHLSSDGSDHSFIDQDVTSGSTPTFSADNFSDGGTNAIVTTTQESNWDTHLSSDGTDHSYIDQDVTSGTSPTFDGANFTGNISVWTNDSSYISTTLWSDDDSGLFPTTHTTVSSTTIQGGVMYADVSMGSSNTTGATVSGNAVNIADYTLDKNEDLGDVNIADDVWTVEDLTISSEAQGTILYYDGNNWVILAVGTSGQVLHTNGAGSNPTWDTDDSGGVGGTGNPGGSDQQVQYNDATNFGGDAGFTYNLTSNTVTATTILSSRFHTDGTMGAEEQVTGGTVSGNIVKSDMMTFPNYSTIQFTIEQPDQLDTSDMLTVWSNDSELDFNIVEVKGWSDTAYDVILGHTTDIGSDEGILANFSVDTAGVSLYYGSNTSVSQSVITTNTVYFDATDWTPNHIKVTIKGYYTE